MQAPRATLAAALTTPRFQQRALFAVAAFILLARLGAGHLANFDDCYYAEKASQMVATGDWVTVPAVAVAEAPRVQFAAGCGFRPLTS